MNGDLPIARPMRRNEIAQDAPGTIFSRGVATSGIPLFRPRVCSQTICALRGDPTITHGEHGVDAAVPVDAQNASTRDLENCTNRSFPQRPHRSLFSYKRNKNNRERCKCANQIVSTEGFTPRWSAQMCAHRITMLFGGGIANSTHKILRSASAYAAYTYRLR